MTKELQDQAWSVLPKEFKEEVKRAANIFSRRTSGMFGGERTLADTFLNEFIDLFGRHNLTSDAEGEEVLTIEKGKVQFMFDGLDDTPVRCEFDRGYKAGKEFILHSLFGSKCLPDLSENLSEQGSAEPKVKYSIGQKVKGVYADEILTIKEYCGRVGHDNVYKVEGYAYTWNEYELQPYAELEASTCTETCTDDCSSPGKEVAKMKPIESMVSVYLATKEEDEEFRLLLHENGFTWNSGQSLIRKRCWSSVLEEDKIHCVYPDKTVTYYGNIKPNTLTFSEFKKRYSVAEPEEPNSSDSQFDTILKDSFAKERRLNIAVQILSGIVASDKPCKHPVKRAVELTDALLAEYGKGGKS